MDRVPGSGRRVTREGGRVVRGVEEETSGGGDGGGGVGGGGRKLVGNRKKRNTQCHIKVIEITW